MLHPVPTSAPPAVDDDRPLARLRLLFDDGSIALLSPGEGERSLTAARGLVDGRPVVAYAQDSAWRGGSVGTAEADVVVGAMAVAERIGAPLVAFLESAGARLQDGPAALGGFSRIFAANVALAGVVPQISVITGTSAGGGCYSPALTDFVVMTRAAEMFLTGPKIVREAVGEDVSPGELGGPGVHERNGVCSFVVDDDASAAELVRDLLGYLRRPLAAAGTGGPDPGRHLPGAARQVYDVRAVIGDIVDDGRMLEVAPRWARNLVTGFARIEGRAVGIVANQPRRFGGVLDVSASEKGARFVDGCDRHGIPLVVLVDTPGFLPGTAQEAAGCRVQGSSQPAPA